MKVILNQDIPNLGEEGEIKDVARGYARNFLIPKKLVLPYTREALAIFESRKEAIEARKEEKRKGALDIKTRLESEPLELKMPAGERGRLFGSVTNANIADALAAKGIDVERRRIDIPDKTIKSVGTVYVRVRLYGDEEAELRVDVTASGAKPEGAVAEAAPATSEAAPATADEASEAVEAADAATEEAAPAEDAPASEDAPEASSDDTSTAATDDE